MFEVNYAKSPIRKNRPTYNFPDEKNTRALLAKRLLNTNSSLSYYTILVKNPVFSSAY